MSTQTNFVRTNNRYESDTGNIISAFKTASQKTDQVIDGFVKAPQLTNLKKISSQAGSRRQVKAVEYHKRAEKAQTLMRSGLKKPAQSLQANLGKLSKNNFIDRELRAKITPRHSNINRFGGELKAGRSRPAPQQRQTAKTGELISNGRMTNRNSAAAPLPSMVASASHQKLERLLDEALVRADAHKEAMRYQAARHFWQRRWFNGRRRWLTLAALLVIALGGAMVSWQNIPQVSVKVAGMQAHMAPSIPTYMPEGFSLAGPAKAVAGAVKIEYKSTANNGSSLAIDQTASNLTSTSLAQSVIPKSATVQTSQVEGNTVYIYGPDNDAAWVNNGILYKIKDNANLSSDELIKIIEGLNQ